MMIRVMLASALALALAHTPVFAQRNEVTLEAAVVRGALGYARHTSARLLLGVEVGFGFPQIDITLAPEGDSIAGDPEFEEYLHVAVFARWKLDRRFEIDTGLRGSVADMWECFASDCWPSLFGGAYVQPMFGGSRFKVGARLTAGVIGEKKATGLGNYDENSWLVAVSPLLARVTFPW